jgi:hypothetical protein
VRECIAVFIAFEGRCRRQGYRPENRGCVFYNIRQVFGVSTLGGCSAVNDSGFSADFGDVGFKGGGVCRV